MWVLDREAVGRRPDMLVSVDIGDKPKRTHRSLAISPKGGSKPTGTN